MQDERDERNGVQALERHSTISLSPISHDPTKVNGVQFAQPFWRKAGVMRRSLKTLMTLMPERLGTSLLGPGMDQRVVLNDIQMHSL